MTRLRLNLLRLKYQDYFRNAEIRHQKVIFPWISWLVLDHQNNVPKFILNNWYFCLAADLRDSHHPCLPITFRTIELPIARSLSCLAAFHIHRLIFIYRILVKHKYRPNLPRIYKFKLMCCWSSAPWGSGFCLGYLLEPSHCLSLWNFSLTWCTFALALI